MFRLIALTVFTVTCVLGNVINVDQQQQQDSRRRYDGDKVFRLLPQSQEQVRFLESFLHSPSEQFDFWKEPSVPGRPADLHVSANLLHTFLGLLNATKIPNVVTVEDVQKLVDDVDAQNAQHAASSSKYRSGDRVVNTFPTLAELYSWEDSICSTYASTIPSAACGIAGSTYEKRDIRYIKLSAASSEVAKKTVFIEGAIHAREWLGTASIVYLIDKMLTTYKTDPVVKRMLDTYDWIIIPVVNADGYVYTHTTDRLWRKTRSKSSALCYGADPNRNWDHNWASVGTSTSPCADTYHGAKAFSEIETKTLSDFVTANKANALAYFAVHAYSQYWLIPYGSGPKPSDYTELLRVANIGATALMAVNNKTWKVGNIQDVIYEAAGGSIDWIKDTAGIKYCYGLELRPDNNALNGFVVATTEIEPSALELWAGLVAAVDAMQQ